VSGEPQRACSVSPRGARVPVCRASSSTSAASAFGAFSLVAVAPCSVVCRRCERTIAALVCEQVPPPALDRVRPRVQGAACAVPEEGHGSQGVQARRRGLRVDGAALAPHQGEADDPEGAGQRREAAAGLCHRVHRQPAAVRRVSAVVHEQHVGHVRAAAPEGAIVVVSHVTVPDASRAEYASRSVPTLPRRCAVDVRRWTTRRRSSTWSR
jgi:hypothetical protein